MLDEFKNRTEPPTLKECFEKLYKPRKLMGASRVTKTKYEIEFRHFHKFLGREATTADLNDDVVCAFVGWRAEDYSPVTANKSRDVILALWRFLARKRLVEEFPDVPKLKEPERIPQAWTRDELARLFQSAQREPGQIGGVPAGNWWLTLLTLAWYTAERKTALLLIEWQHVDFENRWLHVPAEHRKGRTRDRGYRLHEDCITLLTRQRKFVPPEEGRVFPYRHDPSLYHAWFKRILKRAGLPHGRRDQTHRIRKSTASHFDAQGGNATKLLDHSNADLTNRSYIDPRMSAELSAADVLFQPVAITVGAEPEPLDLLKLLNDWGTAKESMNQKRRSVIECASDVRVILRACGFRTTSDLDASRIQECSAMTDVTKTSQDRRLSSFVRFCLWIVGTHPEQIEPARCAASLRSKADQQFHDRFLHHY